MDILKLLDIKDIAAQIVCFLLVFFLLRTFAWQRILSILDQRKERIAAEFARIEELRREAEGAKHDYALKIEQIEQAANARIGEAVAEAERIASQIRLKAREDARKIADDAQEELRRGVRKAKEDLKNSVVSLALDASRKIICERLSKRDEDRIVADFLMELEKMK